MITVRFQFEVVAPETFERMFERLVAVDEAGRHAGVYDAPLRDDQKVDMMITCLDLLSQASGRLLGWNDLGLERIDAP